MLYFAWSMRVKTQTCLRTPSQNSLGTVPRPSACSFLTHHLCIQIYLLAHKPVYIKFFLLSSLHHFSYVQVSYRPSQEMPTICTGWPEQHIKGNFWYDFSQKLCFSEFPLSIPSDPSRRKKTSKYILTLYSFFPLTNSLKGRGALGYNCNHSARHFFANKKGFSLQDLSLNE